MDNLLNTEYGIIGRTVSTQNSPNTSNEFHFWVSETQVDVGNIEIGNIVAAYSDDSSDVTFGVVNEMRAYSDVDSFIADYLSHNFGEADIEIPTDISEVIVVICAVMRNASAKTKPVGRSRVFYPSSDGIRFAYGITNLEGEELYAGAPIPVGIFENGDGTKAPISLDENFVLGPEGAHLNVSGISGLASKTSSILFTTKSLLHKKSKRVAVVMFNVKSRDLLYIDQENPRLQADGEIEAWSREAYAELDIPMEPFQDCQFFAPADLNNNPEGVQSLRELPVQRFIWDLSMVYEDIPSLFSSFDWDDRTEGAWFVIQQEIEQGNIVTYGDLISWLNQLIGNAGTSSWPRGVHIATWNKMRFHIQRFPQTYAGLIQAAGQGQDIPWENLRDGSTFVIDIQNLNDRGQRLVFNRAVRTLSNQLERGIQGLDAIVVFVDELNKFAPSGNVHTPLKDRLIDITARGRSVGLILFGAEQFASSVDKEIIENSSSYLFGRTESNELRSPTYSGLSDEVKAKIMTLPQGNLLVKFAKFSQPIFVKFPLPPCLPGDQFEEPERAG